jgi:DNA-binding response OmpR family regulator
MRVLVIDDDSAMTDLLRILLKPAASTIYVANSGMEGISLAKHYTPDLVILDLMMPEMDGYQVCSAIRNFSNVPIMILSALDRPGMVSKAIDAGADDYLIKPVTSSVLIAHVNNLVRRANLPPNPVPANS